VTKFVSRGAVPRHPAAPRGPGNSHK
jgi:hypothetical protein